MADYQITCVNNINGTHEGITHVGGPSWVLPVAEVANHIAARANSFFTFASGYRAEVGVVNLPNGRRYLRTYANGIWTDNLLALGACPI